MIACRQNHKDLFEFLVERDVNAVHTLDTFGLTYLHHCCVGKHDIPQILERLLDLGVNVNSRDDGLKTTAMYASRSGLTDILHCLVGHGANLNLKDKYGQTCLHYACFSKNEDIIRYLVGCGVYINCEDNKKRIPLMTACFRGSPIAVDVLLELGADATKLDVYSEACVHTACKEGHVQVVEVLVHHGVDMEMEGKYGRTPFMYACQYGKSDVVDYLREITVRVLAADKNGANSLHLCFMGKNNDCSIPRKLLLFGINVNSRDSNGMTAIMQASSHGNCLLFDFLYSKGANIAFQDRRRKTCYDFALQGGHNELTGKIRHELAAMPLCLMTACYNGHMTLIKMLIDKVDDINEKGEKGRTALITACLGGQTESAELLISKKADVHLVDGYGISCWQYACASGKVDLVKLLLKQGFTVNTPCQNRITSLMIACRQNHHDRFEFLVEHDVNAVHTLDVSGLTCLHHCCVGKHDIPQILERLLDLGVNVNSIDDGLKTTAMYPSRSGLTNILHCLVEHGADLNLEDKYGQTCLHYACFSKNEDIIRC
ncbi:serine/threonine-protein phosphatase 6 regulatory ankyrin repeat subunit B-like [Gigantopelta aegis]|uniref:serine/threonine-protein phosphatase 6 regulatory ankyrin repeat subunit B-like n=1 Tax=Gigantopelta aegis TaxID=1735272 RepID=UPI001B88770E|nr:serine/threonine-protein phosphatase 6 regulatory ankyrin repeat subunit B-like [Gigantopelta aegis]